MPKKGMGIKKTIAAKEEAVVEPIASSVEEPVTLPAPPEPVREVAIRPLAGAEKPKTAKSVPEALPPIPKPEIVPQPERDNTGHFAKEDIKKLKTVLLYDIDGVPGLTLAVPGNSQRPYWYKDRIAWLGLAQLFSSRKPFYIMQTVAGGIAPYEPDALSPDDFSPLVCYRLTNRSHLRNYILSKPEGWKDIIKTGLVVVCIVAVVVFFWLAWSNTRKVQLAPPVSNSTAITTPIVGGK